MSNAHYDRIRRIGIDGTPYQTAGDGRASTLSLATGAGAAGTYLLAFTATDIDGTTVAEARQYWVDSVRVTAAGPPSVTAAEATTGLTATAGTVQAVGIRTVVTTDAAGAFSGTMAGLTAGSTHIVTVVPIGTAAAVMRGSVVVHA